MAKINSYIERKLQADDVRLFALSHDIGADYSSGVDALEAPFDLQIVDVVVTGAAVSASGTVTVRKGTTAQTDAIAMAAVDVVDRAASLIDGSFASGQAINLITNGAADRGNVTLLVRRA